MDWWDILSVWGLKFNSFYQINYKYTSFPTAENVYKNKTKFQMLSSVKFDRVPETHKKKKKLVRKTSNLQVSAFTFS